MASFHILCVCNGLDGQSLLHGLDLQRQQSGIVPAECQIPSHEPKSGMAAATPDGSHLSFAVPAPDITKPICHLVSKDDPRLCPHVLVSRCEDYLVCLELRAISEPESMGEDLGDLLALLDLDLAVCDHLAGAYVDIVTSAALQVFDQQTGIVGSLVHLESGLLQSFDNRGILFADNLRHLALLCFEQRRRETPQVQVRILDRGSIFLVQALQRDVDEGIGGYHAGGTALHHGNIIPLLIIILRNIVSRVAGANHDRLLALRVRVRTRELGAVTNAITLEALHTLEGRLVLLARVAGRLDNVVWVQSTCLQGTIFLLSFKDDGPLLLLVAPRCRFQVGLGPHVQLEHLHITLEEFGKFVFGCEDGPVFREGDVGHMVEPNRIVKNELAVPSPPAVSDAILVVDNECVDVEHFESGSCRQASLAGTWNGSISINGLGDGGNRQIYTDNDNGRFLAFVIRIRSPSFLPILPLLVLSMFDPFWSTRVQPLFIALQTLQRRKKNEYLPFSILLQQSRDTRTSSHLRGDSRVELDAGDLTKGINGPDVGRSES